MDIPIDESQWPLIIVNYPLTMSDEDVRDHLKRFKAILLAHKQRAGLVSNTGNAHLSPLQRKIIADFVSANDVILGPYLVCNAVVLKSSLQRGIITAIQWLSPRQAFETKTFSALPEALAWAKSRLA